MKTQISELPELINKTIEAYHFPGSGTLGFLTFTDGSFACFSVDRGFESGDETIELHSEPLRSWDVRDDVRIMLGLATAEEIRREQEAADAARKAGQEKCERAELARLKAKYEAVAPEQTV